MRNYKARRTESYCANGHEWTPETTHVRANGWVECLTCEAEAKRRRREKERARAKERRRRRGATPKKGIFPPPIEDIKSAIYKSLMLEAKAEMDAYDAEQARTSKKRLARGVYGDRPGFNRQTPKPVRPTQAEVAA